MAKIEIKSADPLAIHAHETDSILVGPDGPIIKLTPITERGISSEVNVGLDLFLQAAFDSLAFNRGIELEGYSTQNERFKFDFVFTVITELITLDALRNESGLPFWFSDTKNILNKLKDSYNKERDEFLFNEGSLIKKFGRLKRGEQLVVPPFDLFKAIQKHMLDNYSEPKKLAELILKYSLERYFGQNSVSRENHENTPIFKVRDAEISFNHREIQLRIIKVEKYAPNYKILSITADTKCKVDTSGTSAIEVLITESDLKFDSLKSLLEYSLTHNLQNSGLNIFDYSNFNHNTYALKQVNPCDSIVFKIPGFQEKDNSIYKVELILPDINLLRSAELSKYQQFTTTITPPRQ